MYNLVQPFTPFYNLRIEKLFFYIIEIYIIYSLENAWKGCTRLYMRESDGLLSEKVRHVAGLFLFLCLCVNIK